MNPLCALKHMDARWKTDHVIKDVALIWMHKGKNESCSRSFTFHLLYKISFDVVFVVYNFLPVLEKMALCTFFRPGSLRFMVRVSVALEITVTNT